jgi:CBS domain-containing protein
MEESMIAADVMTTDVITADPEMLITDLAKLLWEKRISGVPISNQRGEPVGIVSEGDLLFRRESDTEHRRSWWLEAFSSNRDLAREYVKSHGTKVKDIMTRKVVTVEETTPLAALADLFERHRIKRVPVVRDGKLVGIVTRANLVRAVAMAAATHGETSEEDKHLRDRLLSELKQHKWAEASPGNITVKDGVVHLWGTVLSEEEQDALRVAAENTKGVRAVENHTTVRSAVSDQFWLGA